MILDINLTQILKGDDCIASGSGLTSAISRKSVEVLKECVINNTYCMSRK